MVGTAPRKLAGWLLAGLLRRRKTTYIIQIFASEKLNSNHWPAKQGLNQPPDCLHHSGLVNYRNIDEKLSISECFIRATGEPAEHERDFSILNFWVFLKAPIQTRRLSHQVSEMITRFANRSRLANNNIMFMYSLIWITTYLFISANSPKFTSASNETVGIYNSHNHPIYFRLPLPLSSENDRVVKGGGWLWLLKNWGINLLHMDWMVRIKVLIQLSKKVVAQVNSQFLLRFNLWD